MSELIKIPVCSTNTSGTKGSVVGSIETVNDLGAEMFYLISDLEQGTDAWRTWRRGVIGASEAPTIMGENPWASPRRLMEEKLGLHREFSGNAATREGNRLEIVARKELSAKHARKLRPVIIQDSEDAFLAASLDAMDSTNEHVYEIKCGVKAYEKTNLHRSVPGYYVGQVQHILMITGFDSLCFAAYRPDEPLVTIEVHRDDRYIKLLRKKETEFAQQLVQKSHKIQKKFVGSKVH